MENSELRALLAQKEAEILALKATQTKQHAPTAWPIAHQLDQCLLLMQQVFTALLLSDAHGRITWVNAGFTKMCGLTLEDVLGVEAKLLLGKSLLGTATDAYINHCLAQLLPYEYEVPNPCSTKEGDWIRVKCQPIFDSAGELLFYAGMVEDISVWKQTQVVLTESEQRFRTLIENAPGVLYEWRWNFDGTCQCTYVSPKLQELFGICPDPDQQITDYIHPDDRTRFHESIFQASRRRSNWHFEGRAVVPGQPLRWWRGTAVMSGKDEKGLLYQGILQDITSSTVAQESIRESEQRWRASMTALGNDDWEYDFQKNLLHMSPKYCQLFAYDGQPLHLHSDKEHQGTTPQHKVYETARQTMGAYLRGELPFYSATYRLTDEEGQDMWILSRGMITKRDEHGNPLIATGTHADITEITKTQLALEASTLRLGSTIANLHRAVLLEDENRKVILVNEIFCRLFKLPYTPAQLVGADCVWLAEQIKGEFSNESTFMQQDAGRTTQQGVVVRGEAIAMKDGRTLSRDSTPIYAKNSYIGYLWNYEDITKRRREEDGLKRREEKYRGILENLNLGLVELNLNGEAIFVNDSYCEISGYTKHELLYNTPDQMLLDEANQAMVRDKRHLRAAGISDTYEVPIKTKRGALKWLLVSGAPLYNDEKQIVGSIGVHLDITHQKQLESKLREAKKHAEESAQAKEMFLANMSHEIRTPMNAILGMSQLLSKTPLSTQQNNYLHAISSSAENLLVIINDILDISKIEAGKMAIEKIGFNLSKVCEQVEKTLQYKAEDKGLTLSVQVSQDIPDVLLGDPYRITQVLLNLAGNSIKFTEKGQVSIVCELTGTINEEAVVEFCVSDTGIGIDPAYLKHLFQDFSQEDSSVSRKFGGTGLGLSISQSLVRLMSGSIRIQSEKHRGTISTFSLSLPIGSVADLPRKELTVGSKFIREGLRGKRVLLVEDNEYNRVLAKSFLRQASIEVAEAENGEVAVRMAQEQEFDLILMDVQMPVMNGLEATAQLRKVLGQRLPIIALTANAIRGDNQKCLAAGMNDYLSKPFHEDDLLKIVHEWLLCSSSKQDQAPTLYRPDILKNAAQNDSNFVAFMLRTFLKSSESVLFSMQNALETKDVQILKAAAHKIKPSLAHLQVFQVLAPIEQLESWEGDFDQQSLEPLVEITDTLLRQVMAQITLDLKDSEPNIVKES
ncbi:PAS domain S-box protein [Hymenobacter mucosus]|nr:PAS domain S-box protein [Hymenobacter mucosus]